MIETERLILRPPLDADRDEIAAFNTDPRVNEWLGGPFDRAHSDATVDRITAHIAEHGFGFWAAERKADRRVIGFIGLMSMGADLPPGPAIEVGWRLAADAWGRGLATEGARAALAWGFEVLKPREIIAITARTNVRSQAVMKKLRMAYAAERDFLHPRVPDDSPLKAHVTYAIAAPDPAARRT